MLNGGGYRLARRGLHKPGSAQKTPPGRVAFFGAGDGESGAAPPVADAASRFQGSAPFGGHECGRQTAGATRARSGAAPPVADAASRFQGSAPFGGHECGRQTAGATRARSGAAPPVADAASRFQGSAPFGGHECGRQTAGATRKSPKRCLRQIKRGDFKEVSADGRPERARASADTTRAAQPRSTRRFSL